MSLVFPVYTGFSTQDHIIIPVAPLPPQEQACLLETDMLDYMPSGRGLKRQSGTGHRLRISSSLSGLCVGVYLSFPQRGQFTVLQLVITDNNRYSLDHISSLFTTQVSCDFVFC